MSSSKKELLSRTIEHIDITKQNVVPLVDAMQHMAFTARDLHRAAGHDRAVDHAPAGYDLFAAAGNDRAAGAAVVILDPAAAEHGGGEPGSA